MRILFTSDLQIGSGASYGTPSRPRLADQAEALGEITVIAEDREVELIVIAGDVFQHRRPSVPELLVFERWLQDVPAAVSLLAGNHDVLGPAPAPATIDLFDRDAFTRPAVIPWAPAALAFLPWAHPGALRASRDGASPQEQAAALVEIAAGLRAEVDDELVPILVTHYALTGFSTPTGVATGALIGEPVLDSYALARQGWRYIFAGHIHKSERQLRDGADVVSIGSPWIQDFGEAGVDHGVLILDTETDALDFVEVPGRIFVTLDLDADRFFESYGFHGLEGAVVRLRIKATEETAAAIDVSKIRRAAEDAGAHKVFVELDVARIARARTELAEDAEPLAALDAWAASSGIEAPATERLRELTSSLLPEVLS